MGNIVGRDFAGQTDMDAASVANLHTALKKLVDMEKLARQASQAAEYKDVQHDGLAFQLRNNLHAVKHLDYWLKQCHAGIPR